MVMVMVGAVRKTDDYRSLKTILPVVQNFYAVLKNTIVGPKALLSHDRAGRSELIATDRSLGGNAIAVNSMHLIFPTPLSPINGVIKYVLHFFDVLVMSGIPITTMLL